MFANKYDFNNQNVNFFEMEMQAKQLLQECCMGDDCIPQSCVPLEKADLKTMDYNITNDEMPKYCGCVPDAGDLYAEAAQISSQQYQDNFACNSQCWKGSYEDTTRSNNKSTSLPNMDDNLMKLLNLIYQNVDVSFQQSKKSARGLHNGVSHRRSAYVGVLRNRKKWQVLINVGSKKKYIGTYQTEEEGAIVNDFYSIGVNFFKAKTNFLYSKELIAMMIESYFNAGRVFDPSIFTWHVVNSQNSSK